MPLDSGTRLGPYEIIAPLGAGGMGEVYRARDTRLDRAVAVKVLPANVAADPEALARFDREARAVAALNHPNIIALFDIGREGRTSFVVTELLEGQTLRDRLSAGPLPPRTAVDYARSIADALAAAHERGIVHRDLKPENVFLTKDDRIKVLDFGLAQITTPPVDAGVADAATTLATRPGLMLGTVGYMAPEQVRAQLTDARTDIFAFGVVLYEMLTGVRPFRGETTADAVSAVLTMDPPDLTRSGTMVPPGLDRFVRRCLEKSPAQRFQSARDLSFALEAVGAGASAVIDAPVAPVAMARGPRPLTVIGALLVAAIVATFAFFAGQRTGTPPIDTDVPVGRFQIPAANPTGPPITTVSPTGDEVVYASATSQSATTGALLWFRRLDDLTPRGIGGTGTNLPVTASSFVFWSPDGRQLAYSTDTTLYAMSPPDGPPRRIATLPESIRLGAWSSQNVIVLSTVAAIYRISPDGSGEPRKIVTFTGDESPGRISLLSDGKRFIYNVVSRSPSPESRAASIDGAALGVVSKGVGAFLANGFLLFGQADALMAQRFDEATLKAAGATVEVVRPLMQDRRSNLVVAAASNNGVLVYRASPNLDVRFTWVDRNGRQGPALQTVDSFTNFSVSPDGSRIVTTRREPLTGANSLWMLDVNRNVASLICPKDDEGYGDPTWMPDGQHIVFRYKGTMAMRLANGTEQKVLVSQSAYPDSVSRDGRYVAYSQGNRSLYEMFALDLTTPGAQPIPLVTGLTLADEARFSPNERWVAYDSNEAGSTQVSVIPFPPTGEKWQISQAGGVQPRWSKDGQELFYLDLDGRMMSVRMPESDPRKASAPTALFSTGLVASSSLDQFEPVGDRFLLRIPVASERDTAPVGVIVNWTKLVK